MPHVKGNKLGREEGESHKEMEGPFYYFHLLECFAGNLKSHVCLWEETRTSDSPPSSQPGDSVTFASVVLKFPDSGRKLFINSVENGL